MEIVDSLPRSRWNPTAKVSTPLLARRSFWLTSAAIWSFFGLIVANQLYFSMRDHGHHWWRILVWQMAGAATWMILSPWVFVLKSRFPLEGSGRVGALGIHLAAAVSASLVRMIPMTGISLSLDPYFPVPTEKSFLDEYLVQCTQWLHMDVFLYGTILIAAYAYDYRQQVHRNQLRAAFLEKELAGAELRALKLELQPHFLFNTMNSVVSLVRSGAGERAERMLLGLCELLRSTLDGRRRQLVPLSEEVELTELYLGIQRVRFGERLGFRWQIEAGAEKAMVPALLLQPLIENAVRHAVELGSGRGVIAVRIARSGDELGIDVEDDGAGDGKASAVSSPSPGLSADSPPQRGLGLENVRGRLAALYGEAWSLELGPRPTGGTRVTLRFPWRSLPAAE